MKKFALLLLPLMLQACGEQPANTKTAPATDLATTQTETKTETAKPAEAEKPITVTADELLKGYKENELAGDQKFKDKTLIVTGKIETIESGIADMPFILLKAGGDMEFNKPQAMFSKDDTPMLAKLKKGQDIKLQCVGAGEMGGSPILKDCKVL